MNHFAKTSLAGSPAPAGGGSGLEWNGTNLSLN